MSAPALPRLDRHLIVARPEKVDGRRVQRRLGTKTIIAGSWQAVTQSG
jgi:hypothetical protein